MAHRHYDIIISKGYQSNYKWDQLKLYIKEVEVQAKIALQLLMKQYLIINDILIMIFGDIYK